MSRRFVRRSDRIATGIGGAVVASTPLTIYGANLVQWLRADLGITIVTGVSAWADQSGNGNNAIQATGTAQPAYTASDSTLNNQSTILADGTSDVLSTAALTTNLATDDFYVCAIINAVTWTSGDSLTSGAGTTPPRSFQTGATPAITQTATSGVNSNTAAVLGSWVRYESLWTTTAGVSYLKIGATNATGGNPGTGARTSSHIFAAGAALFGNYTLAEFIVVKTAAGSGGPTGSQRTACDAYLSARYPAASF